MDKRDLAILERIFAEDIEYAIGASPRMPTQFSKNNKRVKRLAAEGYIEPDVVMLGGRFPVKVTGWRLTLKGHATYCFSCDEPDSVTQQGTENGDKVPTSWIAKSIETAQGIQASPWATPTSRDHKDGGCSLETVPVNALLGRQVRLMDFGSSATGSPAPTEKRGQLNPAHSRWLMGLPRVWDDCACTAMQSLPKSRKSSSGRTST